MKKGYTWGIAALLLAAGCSAAPAQTEQKTPVQTEQKTEAVQQAPAAPDQSQEAAPVEDVVESNSLIETITTDLKGRGYRIQNERLEWDNGINPATVKQELECDGPWDYNLWEFDSTQSAAAAMDAIQAHESTDRENRVERSQNLLTITDVEDGDMTVYALYEDVIVETDSPQYQADFQAWGILR